MWAYSCNIIRGSDFEFRTVVLLCVVRSKGRFFSDDARSSGDKTRGRCAAVPPNSFPRQKPVSGTTREIK